MACSAAGQNSQPTLVNTSATTTRPDVTTLVVAWADVGLPEVADEGEPLVELAVPAVDG
jgi:hypothetical protein